MEVCVLLERETLRRWQADALLHMLAHTDTTVSSLVFNDHDADRRWLDLVQRGLELREWAVVGSLYDHLYGPMPEMELIPIEHVVERETIREYHVDPRVVDGWKREIPTADVERIAEEADVAVRFGFGFLVGPVLTAFDHGVLSFHHGDLRQYRGQPAGFWEYLADEDSVGITVQRLSETLDGGSIVAFRSVDIADLGTWYSVRRRLMGASRCLLTEAIRSLKCGTVRDPVGLGQIYTLPKGRDVGRFLLKESIGRFV